MSTTTHTSHIPIPGSRDLSGITHEQLGITIQHNGKEAKFALPIYQGGISYAEALRVAVQTQEAKALDPWTPTHCPYEVVSFDQDKNELTVKLVE